MNDIPLLDSRLAVNIDAPATPSLARQQWLEGAVEALRAKFAEAEYVVPTKIRVSIGWPKRAGSCGAVGECWSTTASSDLHAELFIAPSLIDGAGIVGVLAHELAHATVDVAAGHGPLFKRYATAIGLTGPMRTTIAGPEFAAWTEALIGASAIIRPVSLSTQSDRRPGNGNACAPPVAMSPA